MLTLPFLLEHFYFFYFPEQVGRKDEIVQRLVRVITCSFCSLPFLHAFLNKDDIITNIHHGVHVVGIDNGRHIVLHRNVVNQIIDQ